MGALSLAALSTEQTRSLVLVLAASAAALFISRTSSRACFRRSSSRSRSDLIGPHVLGWAISLAIAIGAGYALQSLGLDAEGLLVGVAVSTGVYCAGSRSGCCSPSQPSRSTPR